MAHERHQQLHEAWCGLTILKDDIDGDDLYPDERDELRRIIGVVDALGSADEFNDLEQVLLVRILSLAMQLTSGSYDTAGIG